MGAVKRGARSTVEYLYVYEYSIIVAATAHLLCPLRRHERAVANTKRLNTIAPPRRPISARAGNRRLLASTSTSPTHSLSIPLVEYAFVNVADARLCVCGAVKCSEVKSNTSVCMARRIKAGHSANQTTEVQSINMTPDTDTASRVGTFHSRHLHLQLQSVAREGTTHTSDLTQVTVGLQV